MEMLNCCWFLFNLFLVGLMFFCLLLSVCGFCLAGFLFGLG